MAEEQEVAVAPARHGDEPARALLERLHDPARVLALSDGVFAIIIEGQPRWSPQRSARSSPSPLAPRFPAVATMLLDAREDLTAFASFPVGHQEGDRRARHDLATSSSTVTA